MLMVGNIAGAGVNYGSPTLSAPVVEVAHAAVSEVTLHRL
jgi:hypothetical protein